MSECVKSCGLPGPCPVPTGPLYLHANSNTCQGTRVGCGVPLGTDFSHRKRLVWEALLHCSICWGCGSLHLCGRALGVLRASLSLPCWKAARAIPSHLLPVAVLGDGKPVPVHGDLPSGAVWGKQRCLKEQGDGAGWDQCPGNEAADN